MRMPKKRRLPAEPKRVSRALELARLDALQATYYNRALKGDIEAAEICIDIIARRASLLGLTCAIKRGGARRKAQSVAAQRGGNGYLADVQFSKVITKLARPN
jgi:hypothetical protein